MFLNGRSDSFDLRIPKVFIPSSVKERWQPYFKRLPSPTDDISDIINWSIQSISFPSINYTPVEQTRPGFEERKHGTSRSFRGGRSSETMLDRKFEITFKAIDGYVNYWVLFETFLHHYSFSNDKPYVCDFPLRIKDAEGINIYQINFIDVLFTGIDQFSLNFSEQSVDAKTFSCNFTFNEMNLDFVVQ